MENTTTEYKRELNADFEKEVCAFINTIGGQIFIGVEDNGDIYGVDNADKVSLAAQDRIKNNIFPSVVGLFGSEIKEKDGKKYIIITVAGGLEKPYYVRKYGMSPSGCYMRVGSQSIQMPQTIIDDLFARRVRNTLHNVVSPNQDLTFTQLKIFYEGKGYDISGNHFLKNLDLFTEDGKYNYAAYLMSDNNGTSIKVARFKGTEKFDILERNEYGRCCLIKSATNVLEKLNVVNATVVRVGGAARRREIKLVDSDALREAVLNAIIHNDYINGSYPAFEIYEDRFEIISSGGLPIGLSEDEFFEGRSLPRNKELMRIFSDMDMCEQLGSGMKKILRKYPRDVFEISEHFVAIRFAFSKEALNIAQTENATVNQENATVNQENATVNQENATVNQENATVNQENATVNQENATVNFDVKLNKTEIEILAQMDAVQKVTIPYLVNVLKKHRATVARNIKSLKEKGIIRRVGSDKTGYWERIF